jgi:two-component system phosphate regulon sensor histidine kinase PhoR
MAKPRLFTVIFLPIILLTLLSILLLTRHADQSARKFYLKQTEKSLLGWVELTGSLLKSGAYSSEQLDSIVQHLDSMSHARFTLIAEDGRVLSDSRQMASLMENHRERPEIRKALSGEMGVAIRPSPILKQDMMYLALPLTRQEGQLEVIRGAIALDQIADALRSLYYNIALGGLLIFGTAVAVSYFIARRIARPVHEMQTLARQFGQGDFTTRIPTATTMEMASLSGTLNDMATRLREKIQEETHRRGELSAVLGSMTEGVIATDPENRILFINRAAERQLGVTSVAVIGQTLPAAIRHAGIVEFISKFSSQVSESAQFERNGLILQVTGTELNDEQGTKLGTLTVVADVTRLKQLETVRRDFVANVSHELRTPITSIKGSAETLATALKEDTAAAARFVEMIHRNSDRMIRVLDDLLSLARLEQADRGEKIAMTSLVLSDIVSGAIEQVTPAASSRQIVIEMNGEASVGAGSAQLLEQAVVNLLENAVKYSPPETTVRVTISRDTQEASILVADQGVGIEPHHLPRLFERFYRVDASRSRQEGGTGLGLAIVKHIALTHGGRVSVKSTPGTGSTFGIHIPVGEGIE